MDRKLASIRKIEEIKPIQGANKICAYRVGGWWVVDTVNKYSVGDLAVYYEIDSFLPTNPEFEFLRKNSYKKMPNGDEGFRLKTIKLRGQLSQGLLTKIPDTIINPKEGDDITEVIGIVKYEPPIPAQLAGLVKGLFPSFIPKTDEIRVQNFESDTGLNVCGSMVYITEKLDGTSFTCYFNKGEFGVCSRNLELKETSENTHWSVANKMKLREKLSALGRNIALQGELCGTGIQKNMYRFNDQRVYFFTAYDIDNGSRLHFEELKDLISSLELEMVPILDDLYRLPSENLVEKMLAYADGKSFFNNTVDREGVVIRGLMEDFSFKAISNTFLLKND